jgi:hypothetical protein
VQVASIFQQSEDRMMHILAFSTSVVWPALLTCSLFWLMRRWRGFAKIPAEQRFGRSFSEATDLAVNEAMAQTFNRYSQRTKKPMCLISLDREEWADVA